MLLDSALAMFPGEWVEADIRIRAKHAEGVVTRIVQAGPLRVEPGCQVGRECGACQMWGSGSQYHSLKRMMVEDLLHRQLANSPVHCWYPAPGGTKRSRIQLHWDGHTLGFHAQRSNDLVAVDGCPMAVAVLSEAIVPLHNALKTESLPSLPARWELATDTPARVVAACPSSPGQAWELEGGTWEPCHHPLLHQLGGHGIAQFPGAFFQVCPEWAWEAFSRILHGWGVEGNTLYDLYGGGGFFSLLLAGHFQGFRLVESAELSVEAARLNLAGLASKGLSVEIISRAVEQWLPEGLGSKQDVILLDPPRAGLPKSVSGQLATAKAKAIVLVGCDGMSFCRDIRRLGESWRLEKLAVIDLFPNSVHAEFVGLLLPIKNSGDKG